MLEGFDISHHNGLHCIDTIVNDANYDFVIMKATEGKNFVDSQLHNNIIDAEKHGLLMGMYHYARPELNVAYVEAIHFLEYFKPYIGKAIPILDWEGEALKYPPEWGLEWMNYVYEQTGVRPLLYISKAETTKMTSIEKANYGLYVARWAQEVGNVAPWGFWALWQYTNKPYDMDKFNGNKEQWMAYCTPEIKEPENVTMPKQISVNTDMLTTINGSIYEWHGEIILNSVSGKEML